MFTCTLPMTPKRDKAGEDETRAFDPIKWKLSATATFTMTVAEREGCPLSSTITLSLCLTASLSDTWRMVLISPFWRPTSNRALSVAFCSL
uniref:Uncharacterized protein n=1 Tax=Takifugu rubripes TaxID=31033 RepID=A0A674NS68_TAKRU